MKEIKLDTIQDVNDYYGATTFHPLVTVVHPDFLRRTNLGRNIQRYEFFSYSSTEALHLSETEVMVFKQVLETSQRSYPHIDSLPSIRDLCFS